MVRRIADALDFDYPQAANLLDDLMTLAGTAYVVESEELAPLLPRTRPYPPPPGYGRFGFRVFARKH
jgi:hypothetical protein